jgi:hypothetical protein
VTIIKFPKIKTTLLSVIAACAIGYSHFGHLASEQNFIDVSSEVITATTNEVIGLIVGEKTYDLYGTDIIFQDFSDINFEIVPNEKIDLPRDLKSKIKYEKKWCDIDDFAKFEKLVWQESQMLGYKKEDIALLLPKEVIEHSINIVINRFDPRYVDSDKDFIKIHGKNLSIDKYFTIGEGDCDKYACSFLQVFDLIKDNNPNLENVYATREWAGGNLQNHAWNALILVHERDIVISHIDSIFYDSDKSFGFEADEYHLSTNRGIATSTFYKNLGELDIAYEMLQKSFTETNNFEEKEWILSELAYLGYRLGEIEKTAYAKEEAEKIGVINEMDEILYFSYEAERSFGNKDYANSLKERLIEEFPDSFWTRKVNFNKK